MMRPILCFTDAGRTGQLLRQGILDHIRDQSLDWELLNGRGMAPQRIRWWRSRVAGFIGDFSMNRPMQDLELQGLAPTVQLGGWPVGGDSKHMIELVPDADDIGRLAADHLINRGCRHLLCLGKHETRLIAARFPPFLRRARQRQMPADWFDPHRIDGTGAEQFQCTMDFIRNLPAPVGLFLHRDLTARWYANQLVAKGFRVPQDLAILGCGNETAHCESGLLTLSSIDVPWRQIGRRGALELHRCLDQDRHREDSISLPVYVIKERDSTRLLPSDDPYLRKVVRTIRGGTGTILTIDQLARRLKSNKWTLQRRFNKSMPMSLGAFMSLARLEAAQQLLVDTDLPISAIARQTGYQTHQAMCNAFTTALGKPPSALRR